MKYLLLILLVSCGSKPFDTKVVHDKDKTTTNAVFNQYIDRFNTEFNITVDIPIVFEELEDYIGVCYTWTSGYQEISIDPAYWETINDKQREQLIFHELGHCVLNLDHNDDTIVFDGVACPVSIMRSFAFNKYEIDKCYEYDYQHYVEELRGE